eukprot:COSAG04_NODE_9738_length_836_cov_0.786974_2_plen_59_part_00
MSLTRNASADLSRSGVGNGTQRIQSGDVIAVDGDGGTVTILDEAAQAAAAAAGLWQPA